MEDEPIKIDDKEYKIADLSDKGRDLVESLRFTEAELGRAKLWWRFRNGQVGLS